MPIGYIVKRYPRLSETFIVQEILQMERHEADLVVFAIMDPREPLTNPAVHTVQAPVHYIQRSFWRDALGMAVDHARLIAANPPGYIRALGHLLRSRFWQRATLRAFLQAGRLARLAREARIEHLHAHFAHNPTTLARYASLITGIPYSFTAHAKDLYLSRPESLVNKAERATFIATCTDFNATYLRGVLPDREHDKIHVVYHGVDTGRFRPPLQRPTATEVQFVSVGRLVPKKGYAYLIDAVRLLNERGVRLRLDIFGGGPLREVLFARLRECGLDDVVKLHGACSQDELVNVYREAHAFVLAPVVMEDGDRDGIPNVLLEAMASGLPVVSSSMSGIPEVVSHGHNGLLVPPRDSQALALAMESLIASPETRAQLGRAARATIEERFDADQNAQRMAVLLGLQEMVHANRVHSR